MGSMDELRSPSLPTSPAAPVIVFPSPSMLSVLQLLGTIRCPKKPRAAQWDLQGCVTWVGSHRLAGSRERDDPAAPSAKQERSMNNPQEVAPGAQGIIRIGRDPSARSLN